MHIVMFVAAQVVFSMLFGTQIGLNGVCYSIPIFYRAWWDESGQGLYPDGIDSTHQGMVRRVAHRWGYLTVLYLLPRKKKETA